MTKPCLVTPSPIPTGSREELHTEQLLWKEPFLLPVRSHEMQIGSFLIRVSSLLATASLGRNLSPPEVESRLVRSELSAVFPTLPTRERGSGLHADQTTRFSLTRLITTQGTDAFSASEMVYESPVDDTLDARQEEIADGIGARIIASESTRLGTVKGRHIEAMNTEHRFMIRFGTHERSSYQCTMVTQAENEPTVDHRAFLESCRVNLGRGQ